ncbi:replication factor-a protein 1 [Amylocarpus encephaloides]|uniref:Replication protein A subunit n=1 Tax=Amylocarpus encephaloides TaxID=45428 RepID=A0A9P7YQI5_9HELO|nr:replication factor-a protein 1 [Amylocarpus encephaloides]
MENARSAITTGALNAIFNDPETLEDRFPVPVCQCVHIKTLNASEAGAPERFRLVLSDVDHFVQSMLGTQANHVVHEGKLKKGSIVRLKSYQANEVKGKKILIILDIEVIESLGELEKIGEPEALTARPPDAKPQNTTIAGNGFYGNKLAAPAQQHQSLPQRTGPSSSSSHANIYPIEALSPYAHKWTIKARVTSKSDIKTWSRAGNEGKLFSINLLDESGEIKATGFNAQCDQLYDVFQEGSVYYISSPCRVQMAKKQFSNIPNDYELSFDKDTVVEKCEDQDNLPQVRFNFTNIANLQDIDKDSTIDVIGVLKDVHEVTQITSKASGTPYDKRELVIVDDSGYSVRMTIWGKTANKFDANPESIVAFKGAKVSDFNGRSLSLLSSGSMTLDPDIAEAHKLKGWYDSQGRGENFASHTNSGAGAAGGRSNEEKTISQVKEEGLGTTEGKDDYFALKATIVCIKQETISYPACASENCNKKVTDVGEGWRCEKCEVTHPAPEHRYIMTINASDHTGSIYLNCFDDVGRLIMGMTASQLMDIRENDYESGAEQKAFDDANCKMFNFTCRAKMDNYNDQTRIRNQVLRASPVDFKTEARKLTELIKKYNIEE